MSAEEEAGDGRQSEGSNNYVVLILVLACLLLLLTITTILCCLTRSMLPGPGTKAGPSPQRDCQTQTSGGSQRVGCSDVARILCFASYFAPAETQARGSDGNRRGRTTTGSQELPLWRPGGPHCLLWPGL